MKKMTLALVLSAMLLGVGINNVDQLYSELKWPVPETLSHNCNNEQSGRDDVWVIR